MSRLFIIVKNFLNQIFKKKSPFGSLISAFFRIFRNFFRKIKIFINGNYFVTQKSSYIGDGLASNHVFDFMLDEKFIHAYNEGKNTGAIKNHPTDIHYRAYIACYFANHALNLEGDFVECGIGKGLLAKTICVYLNFEKINKNFFLFDTFAGIPLNQAQSNKEKELMKWMNETIYAERDDITEEFILDYFSEVKNTFSKFSNVKITKGIIPDSLNKVSLNKISFISMDLNNAFAEIKAIEFLWHKIEKNGIILLDDYAYSEGFRLQKNSWDKFAKEKNLQILTLPTGQGLLIKN